MLFTFLFRFRHSRCTSGLCTRTAAAPWFRSTLRLGHGRGVQSIPPTAPPLRPRWTPKLKDRTVNTKRSVPQVHLCSDKESPYTFSLSGYKPRVSIYTSIGTTVRRLTSFSRFCNNREQISPHCHARRNGFKTQDQRRLSGITLTPIELITIRQGKTFSRYHVQKKTRGRLSCYHGRSTVRVRSPISRFHARSRYSDHHCFTL